MNSTKLFMLIAVMAAGIAVAEPLVLGHGKDAFTVGEKLYETDFSSSNDWKIQVEQKGVPGAEKIKFGDGMLDLYMPERGCTAWLKKKFKGPIAIVYQVKCPLETIQFPEVQARDINNFWHCSHPGDAEKVLDSTLYDGGFGSYSKMQGYYASTGGGGHEGNHTTRFRRYPREVDGKPYPHIALNDRDDQEGYLITPGKWHTVQLVACNGLVQYIVDGKVVYEIKEGDPIAVEQPDKSIVETIYSRDEFPAYTEGCFGFRLVRTHHQYKNLKVYRLNPKAASSNDWNMDLSGRLGVVPVDGGFRQEGYWVWGSSIVKGDDGKYHMYVSRWPKTLKFHPGWMVASEIVHAVSDTAVGPYVFSDVALGKRSPQYWDGQSCHNPKVFKHGDTYILFYMGSTHPFDDAMKHPDEVQLNSKYSIVGRSNKRIGVATSKSPQGPWMRMDAPVLDTKPDTFYSFLTSNPTPVIHEDGSVLLIFKSRKYNDRFPYQSNMMLGVATAPHYTGPYTVVMDQPIFSETRFGVVEDPYLWKDESGYHMLAKDMRGVIAGKPHAGIVAHSKDGLNWEVGEHPLAYTKDIKWDDGTEGEMGQLERVQGVLEDGELKYLSFAVMDGPGGFSNGSNTWNIVVPLNVE